MRILKNLRLKKVINNINVSSLSDEVTDAILIVYSKLDLKEKLIVYSKLIHGDMFEINNIDLFNIQNGFDTDVYTKFINDLKVELNATH